MIFLWAFLILIGFWGLTTILSGIFGLLIPVIYFALGYVLGVESVIVGAGGVIGSLINIYATNRYINTQGAMSNTPMSSLLASFGFVGVFILTIALKYVFKIPLDNVNYWFLFAFTFVIWIILSFTLRKRSFQSIESFEQSVTKFKIVEKYNDDPRWATYLYLENGKEGWNQTIPGSFLAKHPKSDLTFVHNSKGKAIEYAKDVFINATYIED